MAKVTLKEVRERCTEGRFFSYVGRNDRLFAPPSVFLVWFFVRIGWSGNAVTLLSGAFVAAGAMLMATNNPALVVLGSFGYIIFFLLDYVDGGVARYRRQTGSGGQYLDWMMHAVAAVGTAAGLFAGALHSAGPWIIPFGVLGTVAAALSLDRYALAWFAIVMHYQQRRAAGDAAEPAAVQTGTGAGEVGVVFRTLRNASTVLFHESYAIYLLPALAFAHLLLVPVRLDFRVVLTVLGGLLYFPVILCDIWRLAAGGWVDNAYRELFFSRKAPRLPEDHFLG